MIISSSSWSPSATRTFTSPSWLVYVSVVFLCDQSARSSPPYFGSGGADHSSHNTILVKAQSRLSQNNESPKRQFRSDRSIRRRRRVCARDCNWSAFFFAERWRESRRKKRAHYTTTKPTTAKDICQCRKRRRENSLECMKSSEPIQLLSWWFINSLVSISYTQQILRSFSFWVFLNTLELKKPTASTCIF